MTNPDETKEFAVGSLGRPEPSLDHRHLKWLRSTARKMAEDHKEIFEDAGSTIGGAQEAGHRAEAKWAKFLKGWLPPTYEVGVRKYIVGEVDARARLEETDLIVYRPSYPRKLRDEPYVMASGVAAAFSVKNTIKADSIFDAATRCADIQRSLGFREGNMRKELVRPFPYGLLALGHDWKSPNSTPSQNVSRELVRRDREISKHPKESLDFVFVPDIGLWTKTTHYRLPWFPDEDFIRNSGASAHEVEELIKGSVTTVYVHKPDSDAGQSFASFLAALYSALAQGDEPMSELARGLGHMGGLTEGSGQPRHWEPTEVLTPPVLQSAFERGGPPNTDHAHLFGVVSLL